MGYFCKQLYSKELSKIAQSGHSDHLLLHKYSMAIQNDNSATAKGSFFKRTKIWKNKIPKSSPTKNVQIRQRGNGGANPRWGNRIFRWKHRRCIIGKTRTKELMSLRKAAEWLAHFAGNSQCQSSAFRIQLFGNFIIMSTNKWHLKEARNGHLNEKDFPVCLGQMISIFLLI